MTPAISPVVIMILAWLSAPVLSVLAQTTVATSDSPELRDSNSKQFVHYGGSQSIDQLIEFAANKSSNVLKLSAPASRPGFDLHPEDKSSEKYLLLAAANADAIVVGEPLDCRSALTERNRFVFSDCNVAIDRILLSRGLTFLPGQHVVVTRPGGRVQLLGKTVIGHVPDLPAFTPGDEYVLFLHLLPNGSFKVFAGEAIDVASGSVQTTRYKRQIERTKEQLFADIDNAIKRTSREKN